MEAKKIPSVPAGLLTAVGSIFALLNTSKLTIFPMLDLLLFLENVSNRFP
jgi:hypothetical protein